MQYLNGMNAQQVAAYQQQQMAYSIGSSNNTWCTLRNNNRCNKVNREQVSTRTSAPLSPSTLFLLLSTSRTLRPTPPNDSDRTSPNSNSATDTAVKSSGKRCGGKHSSNERQQNRNAQTQTLKLGIKMETSSMAISLKRPSGKTNERVRREEGLRETRRQQGSRRNYWRHETWKLMVLMQNPMSLETMANIP